VNDATTGGSDAWDVFFRVSYRIIRAADPLIRGYRRLVPLATVEDLYVVGRTSGLERCTLVTVLTVDGSTYVGHPNGTRAAWVRNLLADGHARLVYRDGHEEVVQAVPLASGPERSAVVRANAGQQPVPANVAYWLARRHIEQVGVYFRVEPEVPDGIGTAASTGHETDPGDHPATEGSGHGLASRTTSQWPSRSANRRRSSAANRS
jgi:hypothetical protein